MNCGDIWGAVDLFAAPQHIGCYAKARGLNPIAFGRGRRLKRTSDLWLHSQPVLLTTPISDSDVVDFAKVPKPRLQI